MEPQEPWTTLLALDDFAKLGPRYGFVRRFRAYDRGTRRVTQDRAGLRTYAREHAKNIAGVEGVAGAARVDGPGLEVRYSKNGLFRIDPTAAGTERHRHLIHSKLTGLTRRATESALIECESKLLGTRQRQVDVA